MAADGVRSAGPARGVRFELARGGRWFAANAIDAAVGALFVGAALVGTFLGLGVQPAPQLLIDFAHASPSGVLAVFISVPFVVLCLVLGVPVMVLGATTGQFALGLRVVSARTGKSLPPLRAALRGVASALGTVCFAAGPLWGILVDRRRRGLGDLLARSVVVRVVGERG